MSHSYQYQDGEHVWLSICRQSSTRRHRWRQHWSRLYFPWCQWPESVCWQFLWCFSLKTALQYYLGNGTIFFLMTAVCKTCSGDGPQGEWRCMYVCTLYRHVYMYVCMYFCWHVCMYWYTLYIYVWIYLPHGPRFIIFYLCIFLLQYMYALCIDKHASIMYFCVRILCM